MKKYSIDCFEKKGMTLIKSIPLEIKKVNFRILLKKWNRQEVLDNLKINKKLKMKLESRFHKRIPISRYDCFFCEIKI